MFYWQVVNPAAQVDLVALAVPVGQEVHMALVDLADLEARLALVVLEARLVLVVLAAPEGHTDLEAHMDPVDHLDLVDQVYIDSTNI